MLKKLLSYLGSLIAIISLVFIGQQLQNNWYKVDSYHFTPELVGILIIGAVSYCFVSYLLPFSWGKILNSLCSNGIPTGTIRSIYARTQIAKYIPGNIMQIASRHLLIRQLGIAHKPLVIATFGELATLSVSSCMLTIIGSAVFGLWGHYINQQQLYYGLVIVSVFLLLIPFIYKLGIKIIPTTQEYFNNSKVLHNFFIAYLGYTLFFIFTGIILLGLVVYIHGIVGIYKMIAIIATLSVSWFFGLVTPGAPSGIGVRETILMVSLNEILESNSGALIAILFRIITVGGDILFFGIAGRGHSKNQPKIKNN
ncbi:MAG: hypothetical protein KAH20_10505 [Methylococcales bacterium]|nr:hypothetical protein [Methylococcales bacterium]